MDADEAFVCLLVCDRCEKVRSVKGAVPEGRWTCCHQPAAPVALEAAGEKRDKLCGCSAYTFA
jgi:hypothetical protein